MNSKFYACLLLLFLTYGYEHSIVLEFLLYRVHLSLVNTNRGKRKTRMYNHYCIKRSFSWLEKRWKMVEEWEHEQFSTFEWDVGLAATAEKWHEARDLRLLSWILIYLDSFHHTSVMDTLFFPFPSFKLHMLHLHSCYECYDRSWYPTLLPAKVPDSSLKCFSFPVIKQIRSAFKYCGGKF